MEDVAEDSKGKVFNKSPSVMSPTEKPALKVKNNVIWLDIIHLDNTMISYLIAPPFIIPICVLPC